MPNFAEKVEVAVDALSYNPPREVDENEFIDASRLVYDGVRDIRQAVLLDRVISSVDIMLVIVCYSYSVYRRNMIDLCRSMQNWG